MALGRDGRQQFFGPSFEDDFPSHEVFSKGTVHRFFQRACRKEKPGNYLGHLGFSRASEVFVFTFPIE